MKGAIFQGLVSGIARFVTLALLAGICLVFGIVPEQVVADLITNAPSWLTHPATRVAALILGGFLGIWTYKVFQSWRAGRTDDADEAEVETEPVDHWAERQRLEISVITNVSAGRQPGDFPIKDEPELSRLRELKDAIDAGNLDAELNGDKANVMSTLTLQDFEQYVAATSKPYWIEVLHRWQRIQNPSGVTLAQVLKSKRIPLLTFLECAQEKGWRVLDPDGYGGFDLIHGLSEAAGLGDVKMLGKPMDQHRSFVSKTGKLQRIPVEAWQNIEIDQLSCFQWKSGHIVGLKADNNATATKLVTASALGMPQGYADLHIETEGLQDWLENDADTYRGYFEKTFGD